MQGGILSPLVSGTRGDTKIIFLPTKNVGRNTYLRKNKNKEEYGVKASIFLGSYPNPQG
jgi:hypothetical protein